MNHIIQNSREIEDANQHDRAYALGWRAATNTAVVEIWKLLNQEHPAHELPLEGLTRVICKACRHVQYKAPTDATGCMKCAGFTLSFFRRTTDVEPAPALFYDNTDHDKALCDCLECDNWRHAEASHDGEVLRTCTKCFAQSRVPAGESESFLCPECSTPDREMHS